MSWWIARVEHTLTEDVPAPPHQVRDFYVNLDNLRLVHPLIESVTELERRDTADGYWQAYRVVDRLRWGPFSFRTTYRVEWNVPEQGAVRSESRPSAGIRLLGTVTFAPAERGTLVTERIQVSGPRPLTGYTSREAVKAHRLLLAGIRSHFESV